MSAPLNWELPVFTCLQKAKPRFDLARPVFLNGKPAGRGVAVTAGLRGLMGRESQKRKTGRHSLGDETFKNCSLSDLAEWRSYQRAQFLERFVSGQYVGDTTSHLIVLGQLRAGCGTCTTQALWFAKLRLGLSVK